MKRYKILLILTSLFFTLILNAFCQSEHLSEELIQSIERRVDHNVNPSIAIGIVDNDGTHFYNFGQTQAEGKLVDKHTIYEIGSVTKVFTAILLAQQVLAGNLELNHPINQYLPPKAQVQAIGDQPITLGSLSDHTSGIPRLPTNMAPANMKNPYADYTVDQMYDFLSSYEPSRKVGEAYEYSNLAQGLLGHILARNAEVSYEQLMKDCIAEPLNMQVTTIVLDEVLKSNLAPGHDQGVVTENWDIPTLAGAGALRSSTHDMAKFLAANLEIITTPIHESMELTHQVRHSKAGDMRVGLGWHIKTGKEGDVIWHNGGTGGYRAFVGLVKETSRGVVVLTNSSASVDDIGFHLLDSSSELQPVLTKSDAVVVPEEILERYVGRYQATPDFHFDITREGTQLYAQATGQGRVELFASSDTEFFLTVVEAKVAFQQEGDSVKSLLLFQGGQEIPAMKIE